MLTWCKSWFCTSGTLDLKGFAKHILAAHLFFFGFGVLGITLPFLVARATPSVWPWLLFPPVVLAIVVYNGILIASTIRFVRYLRQEGWFRGERVPRDGGKFLDIPATGSPAVQPAPKRMLSWYKSWFCRIGTLDLEGYAKHILAAHLFFFGFGVLGIALFWLVLGPMIALKASAWLAWLPFLFGFPPLVLAIVSYFGILIASTKRFVRHLSQP